MSKEIDRLSELYRKTNSKELKQILDFYQQKDDNGITNYEKILKNQKIIRRVDTTSKDRSFEEVNDIKDLDSDSPEYIPTGIVIDNKKIIGLGIHIFNEDVYPLQSFEIYLRNLGLSGKLCLSGCKDLIFVDLYHNNISHIDTENLTSLRIFGIQDNAITDCDVSSMINVQGIDAGMNQLSALDVSNNKELVELYINDNKFTEIDLSNNPQLKYFYCHNNKISTLDTRENPLLRHLNATDNPMKEILSLAPQKDGNWPLCLYAQGNGYVGLKFNPVYNAQWKETGEWEQSYYAYPDENSNFSGWFDENDKLVSDKSIWTDEYGTSRILTAKFN